MLTDLSRKESTDCMAGAIAIEYQFLRSTNPQRITFYETPIKITRTNSQFSSNDLCQYDALHHPYYSLL